MNFANAAGLYQQLRQALQHSDAQQTFTLDLQGLTQLDTALLAVLLELHAQAARRPQSLALHNPPPALRALAQLSEVASLFTLTVSPADG